MIFKAYNFSKLLYGSLCEQCLSRMQQPLTKWRKEFITDVLWLILSIQGKVNFSQLARYGNYCEQRYRQQFERDFDFLEFNTQLIRQQSPQRLVIAFDPSYISKSGKHTPGIGYFWSGCANSTKWGLEICGIAAIDLDNHAGMHLQAVQTFKHQNQPLMEYYCRIIISRKDALQAISKTVVVDAYFSKETFVSPLCEEGFQVVSRFRDDVRLQYIMSPEKTGKRGRPKTNGGVVDVKHPDENYFNLVIQEDTSIRMYTAVVKAVSLKRPVRIVVVQSIEDDIVKDYKIFFSTHIQMEASLIMEIYKSRFQIEFIYRDAKQHTGLTHCQARDEKKLHFHFNISLTAVNIAKAVHWYSIPKQERKAFSLVDVKVINHNILLLEQFFAMYAINPNILKNKQNIKELIYYGTKAA